MTLAEIACALGNLGWLALTDAPAYQFSRRISTFLASSSLALTVQLIEFYAENELTLAGVMDCAECENFFILGKRCRCCVVFDAAGEPSHYIYKPCSCCPRASIEKIEENAVKQRLARYHQFRKER